MIGESKMDHIGQINHTELNYRDLKLNGSGPSILSAFHSEVEIASLWATKDKYSAVVPCSRCSNYDPCKFDWLQLVQQIWKWAIRSAASVSIELQIFRQGNELSVEVRCRVPIEWVTYGQVSISLSPNQSINNIYLSSSGEKTKIIKTRLKNWALSQTTDTTR